MILEQIHMHKKLVFGGKSIIPADQPFRTSSIFYFASGVYNEMYERTGYQDFKNFEELQDARKLYPDWSLLAGIVDMCRMPEEPYTCCYEKIELYDDMSGIIRKRKTYEEMWNGAILL